MTDSMHRLLLVDDDEVFVTALARLFRRRGHEAEVALDTASAVAAVESEDAAFDAAVVDLRLGEESGLRVVEQLHRLDPELRIVVLTGYASIATAVEATKLGATQYLTKPAEPEDIIAAALRVEGDADVPLASEPMSVRRLEWEHVQRVLAEHDGNISAAARALNMHRRTLQRKLQKRPVRR
jgi:two-component system response regulator RegA